MDGTSALYRKLATATGVQSASGGDELRGRLGLCIEVNSCVAVAKDRATAEDVQG
jgi:hypothetical protein